MVQYSRFSRGRSGFDSLVGNSFDLVTRRSVRITQRTYTKEEGPLVGVMWRLVEEVELRLRLCLELQRDSDISTSNRSMLELL